PREATRSRRARVNPVRACAVRIRTDRTTSQMATALVARPRAMQFVQFRAHHFFDGVHAVAHHFAGAGAASFLRVYVPVSLALPVPSGLAWPGRSNTTLNPTKAAVALAGISSLSPLGANNVKL